MTNVTLDHASEKVKVLTPNEHQQLRKLLDEASVQQEETTKMDAFHQALLAAGLVKSIKKPRTISIIDRKLIQVKGKPLSETIVEERR